MAETVEKIIKINASGSAQSVKDLRDNIKSLRDSLVSLDSTSQEYLQISKQIYQEEQKLNKVMSASKNAITPYERSLKALTDTYQNQRQELRALRTALENLDPASREYQVAFERAAEITHELQERQEMLRRSSSDLGVQLSNMQQIGTGIAAGFSAVNAMMVLTGNHSEDLQKVMVKLQAGMALVQGMKGLEGMKNATLGAIKGLAKMFDKTVALAKGNKELSKESTAAAGAQNQLATAEKSAAGGAMVEKAAIDSVTISSRIATAAVTVLKAAVMGIFGAAIVAGITWLVTQLSKIGSKTGEAYKALQTQASNYYEVNEKSWDNVEKMHEREIEMLRAKGATEREINEANLKYHEKLREKYDEEYQALLNVQGVQNKMGEGKIGNKAKTATIIDFPETMNNIPKLERSIQGLMEKTTVDMSKWSAAHILAFDKIKNQGIQTYEDLKNAFWIYRKLIEQWKVDMRFNEIEDDKQEAEKRKEETKKEAADARKTRVQILQEERDEKLKIVEGDAKAEADVRYQYQKLINAEYKQAAEERKNIIKRVEDFNRTALENLDKTYEEEKEKLKGKNDALILLEKEYQEKRRQIEHNNTKNRISEITKAWKLEAQGLIDDAKFQTDYLSAIGLAKPADIQKRTDEVFNIQKGLAEDELRLWQDVNAKYQKEVDERREKEGENFQETEEQIKRRVEVEQKVSELTLQIHELEQKKILDDVKNRTDAYKELINEIDKELNAKLGSSRSSYTQSHQPNSFWQNAAGTNNPTYAAQKEQVEAEYQILVESLNKQIEARKKYLAEVTGLKGDELEQVIGKDKEIASIQLQIAQATTDKTIELAEIQKDAWDTILDSTLSVADSFADVLGSIADTMESNIQHQKDMGEITEDEAEKQMEQVRAIQITQAIINTLSGSIGAFTQASATIPPPAGQIVGAAAAAAVIAAGVAQITQIRNTKKGSSNITSGLKAAAPALTDYTPDYQANLTGNSEMSQLRNALEGTEIRAYVVESDITTSQQRQRRRAAESTF